MVTMLDSFHRRLNRRAKTAAFVGGSQQLTSFSDEVTTRDDGNEGETGAYIVATSDRDHSA